jgi:TPP-dependent pyruvate/acetoin dehydrogenase alpha subunit
VKKEVDTAVEEAKAEADPAMESLWEHIYVDTLGISVRGLDSQSKVAL